MPEESIDIISPDELRLIAISKNISIKDNISNEALQLDIDNAINKIEGLSDLPINTTKYSELITDFSGKTLVLNRGYLIGINKISCDNKSLDHYEYDFIEDGIIIFKKCQIARIIKVEYQTRISKNDYDKKIAPLLEELLLYQIDPNPKKDFSSIKEGDTAVQYSGRNKSPLDIIEKKIISLSDRPIVRMI